MFIQHVHTFFSRCTLAIQCNHKTCRRYSFDMEHICRSTQFAQVPRFPDSQISECCWHWIRSKIRIWPFCQCNRWSNRITLGCVKIYFFICVRFSLKDLPRSSCLCWLYKLDSIRLSAVALIQNGMYCTSMLLLLCWTLTTSWTEECSLCSGCGSASLSGVGPIQT